MKRYIGLDPGGNGGIAAVHDDGKVIYSPFKKLTMEELWTTVKNYTTESGFQCFAIMELVGGYVSPKQGGGGGEQPGARMFNFGVSAGSAEMALVASYVPYKKVGAAEWQRLIGAPLRVKGSPKNAHKNALKEYAQELYPGIKITLAVADALLLATYCQMIYGREPACLY
jgi:hypothetical protein